MGRPKNTARDKTRQELAANVNKNCDDMEEFIKILCNHLGTAGPLIRNYRDNMHKMLSWEEELHQKLKRKRNKE